MADSHMWALDLQPFPTPDSPMRPVGAHLIVSAHDGGFRGQVRVSACGREFTFGTHPRGWWSTRQGNLPLQAHAVHCGADLLAAGSTWMPEPDTGRTER